MFKEIVVDGRRMTDIGRSQKLDHHEHFVLKRAKKVKLLKMSNFTLFQKVFYAICILKSFNSHISVVVCSFFNLGRSQNGVLGNGLTLFQRCILGLVNDDPLFPRN